MRTGSAGNLASLLSHRIPEVKEGRENIRCMQMGESNIPPIMVREAALLSWGLWLWLHQVVVQSDSPRSSLGNIYRYIYSFLPLLFPAKRVRRVSQLQCPK